MRRFSVSVGLLVSYLVAAVAALWYFGFVGKRIRMRSTSDHTWESQFVYALQAEDCFLPFILAGDGFRDLRKAPV
jgi:hypothetical protein